MISTGILENPNGIFTNSTGIIENLNEILENLTGVLANTAEILENLTGSNKNPNEIYAKASEILEQRTEIPANPTGILWIQTGILDLTPKYQKLQGEITSSVSEGKNDRKAELPEDGMNRKAENTRSPNSKCKKVPKGGKHKTERFECSFAENAECLIPHLLCSSDVKNENHPLFTINLAYACNSDD